MKNNVGKKRKVKSNPSERLSFKYEEVITLRGGENKKTEDRCLLRLWGEEKRHITHDILENLSLQRANSTFSTPRT